MPRDLDDDAETAYDAAIERLEVLCAEWDDLGRPGLAAGSTGQLVAHPLLRAITEAEMVATRRRDELRMTRSRTAKKSPRRSSMLSAPPPRKD